MNYKLYYLNPHTNALDSDASWVLIMTTDDRDLIMRQVWYQRSAYGFSTRVVVN